MTELIMNHRQDKGPWTDTHNPTRHDELTRRVLDRQEINLLPESVQKGTSVSQSCLLTRMRIICLMFIREKYL